MNSITAIVVLPLISGLIAAGMSKKYEKYLEGFAILVTGICFVLSIVIAAGSLHWEFEVFSVTLSFAGGGFHSGMSILAAFLWLVTSIFSKEYFAKEREHIGRYWLFVLTTLGATEAVMLSADFMAAFVFFEVLSFTSFMWVIHEETKEAMRAAYTYLFIAVFGGMVLFMGLALLYYATGTLSFELLPAAIAASAQKSQIYAAGVCILIGFGAKAGMFPLHIWLPMAHPVAPSPASALLSGILTKVGIYGILMGTIYVMCKEGSYGYLVLILGQITMVIGALQALSSENLKRTLACSSMSQIGFILTGVAMWVLFTAGGAEHEANAALNGTILHMINHALIKLTLFCAAGVVLRSADSLILDEIRGWGRKKNLIKVIFASGALGISGLPLFNGYLSKTLLHESIVEATALQSGNFATLLHVSEWVFLISSGMTFAYMLKLFFTIFVEKNKDAEKQAAYDADTKGMGMVATVTLSLSAILMPLLGQPPVAGIFAGYMTGNEFTFGYSQAFSLTSLLGSGICLVIGAVVYLVIVKNGSILRSRREKRNAFWHSVGAAFLKGVKAMLTALDYGMDAPVDLFKNVLYNEQDKEDRHTPLYGILGAALTGKRDETHLISGSFSFALMMTCIGILLILFVLIFTIF